MVFYKKFSMYVLIFILITICSLKPIKAINNYESLGGKIIGIVRDLITDAPIEGASVNIKNYKNNRVIFTDIDGKFSLDKIIPGIYEISIVAEDYDIAKCPNVKVESGAVTINEIFMAKKRGDIEGYIKTRNNKPIENALVNITNGKSTFFQTTDFSGMYIINDIHIGNYGITVSLDGYEVKGPESVYISAGTTTRDFTLNKLRGEVYGRAINSKDMRGIQGVFITISDGENSYEAITDSNGDFTITDIYYGDYEINATLDGYEEKSFKNILIRGGNIVNYDIIF